MAASAMPLASCGLRAWPTLQIPSFPLDSFDYTLAFPSLFAFTFTARTRRCAVRVYSTPSRSSSNFKGGSKKSAKYHFLYYLAFQVSVMTRPRRMESKKREENRVP